MNLNNDKNIKIIIVKFSKANQFIIFVKKLTYI